TAIVALFTFTAMNVVSYVRSGDVHHRNLTKLDLAIVGAAFIGAAVGFLWFNAFPAEMIMGDTGSMAFGGALAAFAIMMKVEVLLEAVRLEADDDVLVLGGGALALGAQKRLESGWVYVVRHGVDELEALLGQAHAVGAAGVAYLVGEVPVLPLPDAAVAAALG